MTRTDLAEVRVLSVPSQKGSGSATGSELPGNAPNAAALTGTVPAVGPQASAASPATSNAQKCGQAANSSGQSSTSLAADLNCRVREATRAKIQQRDASKQTETTSVSSNSSSLVDTSSAGDLVNIGLNLAGLTGATKDNSKDANSVSVTTSAYALYAAFKGVDPLNPGFYNRNTAWRKLSFTLGYDDEKIKGSSSTQQARIFGVKYLIIDKRDPALSRHQNDFNIVTNSRLPSLSGISTEESLTTSLRTRR
jgi:hypothetical protein